MTIEEAVTRVPFFAELTDRELDMIRPLCRILEGKDGDYLIREGAPVLYIYILLSGKVGVYKKNKEGKKIWLASLGQGFLFGELSFLDHGPASATIRAGLPYQALAINQEALHRLLDSQPRLGFKMFRALARLTSLRLRRADDMLAGFPGTSRELTVA